MSKKRNRIFILILIELLCINIILPKQTIVYAKSANSVRNQVVIAIIDTGIDYTHERLKDKMWINTKEIPDDGIDNDKNGYIDDVYGWNFYDNNNKVYTPDNTYDDHGTHCAGIIENITANSNIKIMSIKILGGSNRSGTIDSLIQAIQYAEKMGANICNISLGTPYYEKNLERVMQNSNMMFVIAAGNGMNNIGLNIDETPIYPASFGLGNIVTVANVNKEGTDLDVTSNFGFNSVDIATPGMDIYSTLTHNNYGYMSGTSMATPSVTAAIALTYQSNPTITLIQAKEAVLNTVQALPSLVQKVKTGGILNTETAVNYYIPNQINIISEKTLKVHQTYTIKAALMPTYASTALTFTSSNKKVATINRNTGKIKALKKGKTIITVNTSNGLIAKSLIIVKNK